VQDHVRYGGENVVVVRADNERRPGDVPGLQRGWRTYGGILREVELAATDLLYLDHVAVVAEPTPAQTRVDEGRLTIQAYARNECLETVACAIAAEVRDERTEPLAVLTSETFTLTAKESQSISLQGWVPGVQPWSPAGPNLYTVRVILSRGGQAVDERTIRVGFRSIEARGETLLLNGEPIYLTGFNRHEDSPGRGAATDLETARKDLLDMRAAGANFVRLCHYPHHPGELDLCDELGLLAMGEIPLYWWDGTAEGEDACAAKLEAARRQVSAMIRRDINHPSVIFWSVSNENKEERPEVAAGNRQLVRHAKALDPTRLAVHVSNHWRRHPNFEEDDVLCVNAYPSLDRRGLEGRIDYDLAESTRFWREHLRALHERYPGKPILISEFGYASLQGVRGSGLSEDVQAEAIEREFEGMDAPYVCGATIWCWADHPWPAATFAFCRHLSISPYGILTRERHKLQAYWTVQRIFRERQAR
jgi:beta-glucuronidase